MLIATDVTVTARSRPLLQRASIAVRPGEILALVGENGAGKSTLLKVLAGDLAPKTGSVSLDGRLLGVWTRAQQARRRAVLPQDGELAFDFTALEAVLFGRYPHCSGMPGARDVAIARAALGRLDALHLCEREVLTLSGGERGRVMLARAVAQIWEPDHGPRYLLLDEPVASLDLAHQHLALSVLRELTRSEEVGVLAIVHDLNLAALYADRVVALKRGKVLATGTPRETITESLVKECFAISALVLRHPESDCPLVVPGSVTPLPNSS